MTVITLSPEKIQPFSHGAAMRSFVHRKLSNASTGRSVKPLPASQSRLPQPLPIQHRGAQAVTCAAPGQAPKLLDQMGNVLRTNHDSIRTEKTYIDIRTIQELLRQADLITTMIYTHVVNKGPLGVKSPADLL